MRKHISSAIAAAIVGLSITFWAKCNAVVTTDDDVIHPKKELLRMANPYLPIQGLDPVY
jgi:hypothetical protein